MFSLDLLKIFSNAQYVDIIIHGIKLTFTIAIIGRAHDAKFSRH